MSINRDAGPTLHFSVVDFFFFKQDLKESNRIQREGPNSNLFPIMSTVNHSNTGRKKKEEKPQHGL